MLVFDCGPPGRWPWTTGWEPLVYSLCANFL